MKILILLPSWLGDAIMTTPAIENIVDFYHKPEITLIGSSVSIEALKNHPKVIKSYVLEKNYKSLIKIAINLESFDAFFLFRGSLRSKILKLLITSKNKYQFNKIKYQKRHQVEKYNDFASDSLNKNFNAGKLIIYPSLKTINFNSKPTVGINPGGAYGNAKRWYPEEFAQVAAELSIKYEVIIFGGPGEKDIAKDIENLLIEKSVMNYSNLAGSISIEELISRISTLDLFITGDSGPMHIAASFQIPTIAIFGPTKPDETSQWEVEKSNIVKQNLECQPCMQRTCPLIHHDCMKLIKAADVLKAAQSFN